jgi:hypothetical protein
MQADLKNFLVAYLRMVLIALVPIVLTAFMSIPYTLGGHPGEPIATAHPVAQHMT